MRVTGNPESDIKKLSIVGVITSLFRKLSPEMFIDDITTERETFKWEDARLFDLDSERQNKYTDYETMDSEIVELASALDVHADYITAADAETGDVYSVELQGKEKTSKVADAIAELEDEVKLKQRIWFVARNIAKYGESFYENICTKKKLVNIKYLPEDEMFLNYDEKTGLWRKDIPYIQRDLDTWRIIAEFAPWEIVHYKVGEEDYGVDFSILSKLRREFRVVRILEDSLILTRVSNASRRGVYKVDVTGMGEMEAARYVRHIKILNRRRRIFDANGKMKTEADPLTQQDDIYIPVRKGGAESDYTVVGSDTNLGQITDIEHFHNKIFAATKVPKAFLGFERDINAKSTLIQQNVAFTRAIKRQRFALAQGLKKTYQVGLGLKGLDPFSYEMKIRFPSLGEADEEARWTIEQLKAEVVKTYGEIGMRIPDDWIIHKLFMDLQPAEADQLAVLVAKQKAEDEAKDKADQAKQQAKFAKITGPANKNKPVPGQGRKTGPKGTPLTRPKTPYTLARPDSVDGFTPSVTELSDLYTKIRSNEHLWNYIKQWESEFKTILSGRARYEKY